MPHSRYLLVLTSLTFAYFHALANLPQSSKLLDIKKESQELNQTVWSQEVEAQEHEVYFIELWDELRSDAGAIETFKQYAFGSLAMGKPSVPTELESQMTVRKTSNVANSFDPAAWLAWLKQMSQEGFVLDQSEWHHSRFDRDASGTGHSDISMTLHVSNERLNTRYIISGYLKVTWQKERDANGRYTPELIDATELEIMERHGEAPFAKAIEFQLPPRTSEAQILAYDLNNDGLSEIVFPSFNTVLWNIRDQSYAAKPLLITALNPKGIQGTSTAILADFDNDGATDIICNGTASIKGKTLKTNGLFFLKGSPSGQFSSEPIKIETDIELGSLGNSPTITAGDIDGDGDLDLWIPQYKPPYVDGSMPTPFFDANDGFPSFLLVNQGNGWQFKDNTIAAGLGDKRNRRSYSSSFFDYDNDHDLDLLVVSDFSGVDMYQNDGSGQFTDVTGDTFENRSLFGMSHSIADFNKDGLLDIYAVGMSSTTARRLDAMGAEREEFAEWTQMRTPMSYGNRMYIAKEDGSYFEPDYGSQIARAGWAWGCASFDFDNDGDLDIYVANGHFSNESSKDYCTTFWTDDIYRGSSEADSVLKEYFQTGALGLAQSGSSWNGFEHNALFMPTKDGRIRNTSFLMGIALEADCRQVIADDVNSDGHMDLIVVESENPTWSGERGANITVFLNKGTISANWIGVRLKESAQQPSPMGAKIVLSIDGETQAATTLTGDSFRSQHANTKHFGIGDAKAVDYIEVSWPNGTVLRTDNPQINQYHLIQHPPKG